MLHLKMNKVTVNTLLSNLKHSDEIRLMEVCGTHTMAIARSGLKQLLPDNIQLLTGPGCPVCVTAPEDIEQVIALAQNTDVIITTFGDMVRVPGEKGSLQDCQAEGAKVKIVYSPLDALRLAVSNRNREVIFIAVGFETTAPLVAYTIEYAHQEKIDNFTILCLHKTVIPALKALLEDNEAKVHGFILPGHVSAIIGQSPYNFIPESKQLACTISGFEPGDIVESIYMLVNQIKAKNYRVDNQYVRGVRPEGNITALKMIDKVFEPSDASWRGLGIIPLSGLRLKDKYGQYDAYHKFSLTKPKVSHSLTGCICGNILKGIRKPEDCGLFSLKCTPANPVGPCMVSSEGACAASYFYKGQGGDF